MPRLVNMSQNSKLHMKLEDDVCYYKDPRNHGWVNHVIVEICDREVRVYPADDAGNVLDYMPIEYESTNNAASALRLIGRYTGMYTSKVGGNDV